MSFVNTQPQTSQSGSSPASKSWPDQDPCSPPFTLLQDCHRGVLELHTALNQLDNAGTRFTESLAQALQNTAYRCVGDVLTERLKDVYSTATSKSSVLILKEMETMLTGLQNTNRQQLDQQLYGQTMCHISLLFTKLKKQYFALCHSKMADLIHSLLCLKGEDHAAGEVTKLVLKLGLADGLDSSSKSNSSLPSTPWGSPKTRKSRQDASKGQTRSGFRILSFFDRKTPPDERKSSFYVDVEEKTAAKNEPARDVTSSVTAGSHEDNSDVPSVSVEPPLDSYPANVLGSCSSESGGPSDLIQFQSVVEDTSAHTGPYQVMWSSRSQLATEEELESVINLLSGVDCGSGSPMQVIPEVVPPQGPLQLMVPQIYRMPSPASDTQSEDLKRQKSQVHRRSEGCLDLSAIGHNTWPHQHQHHHRASLPSVQIFSASGHRSGYDPPSPVPPYLRDSPSPNYGYRDPPSPGYFRGDPPSPFRAQYANTLGVGLGGVRSNMLSPLQWSTAPPGMGGGTRLGGLDTGFGGHHGTWPAYGGASPLSTGTGDGASWTGIQDCSDLSDDSSTEDQFFAVGKDLSHAIGSKDGSSDEEGEPRRLGQAKNSSTWPPPHPSNVAHPNRGLTPDLLEPPEFYNVHRPIQMQWSDPLSSRSMWQSSSQDMSQPKASHSMQGFGGGQ